MSEAICGKRFPDFAALIRIYARLLHSLAKCRKFIYAQLILARTGEDLHDFVLFADRMPAFDLSDGRRLRPLRPIPLRIDRA